MKIIFYVFIAIITVSCGNKNNYQQLTTKKKFIEFNKTVPYEETVMILGKANENGFKKEPFDSWYIENYNEYTIDSTYISSLKSSLKEVKIKAFMATWCSDSQREIPRFVKILRAVEYDINDVEFIAVSKEKDTPAGFEVGLHIQYVPTLIFYKNDKELNRIIEYPVNSLEQDMITILTGQSYIPSYTD